MGYETPQPHPQVLGEITFSAITIRITLRMSGAMNKTPSGHGPSSNRSRGHDPVNTIGSIPMRSIAISITKDVQDHTDSDTSMDKLDKPTSFLDTGRV